MILILNRMRKFWQSQLFDEKSVRTFRILKNFFCISVSFDVRSCYSSPKKDDYQCIFSRVVHAVVMVSNVISSFDHVSRAHRCG